MKRPSQCSQYFSQSERLCSELQPALLDALSLEDVVEYMLYGITPLLLRRDDLGGVFQLPLQSCQHAETLASRSTLRLCNNASEVTVHLL